MFLIRLILIASVLGALYCAGLAVYLIPNAWMVVVPLFLLLACKKRFVSSGAYGTARWANQNDLKGMIHED